MLGERDLGVVEALRARSPKLAGIYQAAYDALQGSAEKGNAVGRVSVVCHCMRELMMGLPAAMGDTYVPRTKPSSGALIQNLPRLLGRHPELDLAADQELIPVPREVARVLLGVISAQVQEAGRNRSNAASLITGGAYPTHPAINQWMDAYDFFVTWAHLDSVDEGLSLPSDRLITQHIRVVEDVIESRSAAFFDNLHFVEDLLTKINAVVEDGANGNL